MLLTWGSKGMPTKITKDRQITTTIGLVIAAMLFAASVGMAVQDMRRNIQENAQGIQHLTRLVEAMNCR